MDINKTFSELSQYMVLQKQAADMVNKLENQIKEYMVSENLDKLQGLEHTATYKTVVSHRVDSKALKAAMPDVYSTYCKTSASMRFNFS